MTVARELMNRMGSLSVVPRVATGTLDAQWEDHGAGSEMKAASACAVAH